MPRTGPSEGFITKVIFRQGDFPHGRYPFNLPCLKDLDELTLNPKITFLVGENGSGKSTLLEAIAVAAGMNAEGGGRNFNFSSHDTHSSLHEYLTLVRRAFPLDNYFLRAETYYNVSTQIQELKMEHNYGGRPHEFSHGESFLALFDNRFGGDGFYLVDEPEAALSPQRQLALLLVIHRLVESLYSQLVIATHSPILLSYPGATIYECSEDGVSEIKYEDSSCYRITKGFLEDPGRYINAVLRNGT